MSKQKLEFIRTTKVVKFPLKNYIPRIRHKFGCENGEKPHQKRFSVAEKLEILEKLDTGTITMTELADRYGVSRAAIYKIKLNRENILKYSNNIANRTIVEKKRASSGFPFFEMLDEVLFTWASQQRQQGLPINGPQICEVARKINNMMGGDANFKASQGWLSSFKHRHGIKRSKVSGEKLSIDISKYEEYHEDYIKVNKDKDYKVKNIYIGDEAGLNWKSLPQGTRANDNDQINSQTKDKVSILFCANADGSVRLPPLVIGPSKKLRARRKNMYPVTYAAQKSSWMEPKIFIDWYKNYFIPFIKNKQKITDPVLLVIDDCPAHPSVEELNKIDPQFRVIKTYSKIIPVTDFMHRNIIQKAKIMYRKKLLRTVFLELHNSNDPQEFLNNFETIDACYMVAEVWQELKQKDLATTWSQLKKSYEFAKSNANSLKKQSPEIFEYEKTNEFKKLLKKIPGCENCSDEDIKNWLKEDFFDQGWEPLTLDDIIERFTSIHNVGASVDIHCEDAVDKQIELDEKITEDPMDVDYPDLVTVDESIDITNPEFPESEVAYHEKFVIKEHESTSESCTMDSSSSEIEDPLCHSNLTDDLKSSIQEDPEVTNFSTFEVQEPMPEFKVISSDEDTIKALDTIRQWFKLNTNTEDAVVREHLEAIENMESFITTHVVSNSY